MEREQDESRENALGKTWSKTGSRPEKKKPSQIGFSNRKFGGGREKKSMRKQRIETQVDLMKQGKG